MDYKWEIRSINRVIENIIKDVCGDNLKYLPSPVYSRHNVKYNIVTKYYLRNGSTIGTEFKYEHDNGVSYFQVDCKKFEKEFTKRFKNTDVTLYNIKTAKVEEFYDMINGDGVTYITEVFMSIGD